MSQCIHSRLRGQVDTLRTQFPQDDGLPFTDVLDPHRLEQTLAEEGASWRDCLWTPVLTLWTFVTQVLHPDGSCRAAVAHALAWLTATGQETVTPETGPYCKARKRLPETLLHRLTRETGRDLSQQVPAAWRWKGRRVKVVDGTTVSMPDTLANQAAYPQPATQAVGVGFPLARLVVVFCLSCGTVLEAALGRYQGKQTGETALLRSLDEALEPGDVLLADRYFSGYFELALRQVRGIDVVTRLHQQRSADFRQGRRLGRDERLVTWSKPPRPDWMDEATYQALPATLHVRMVRVRVTQRGFRTQVLVVVTTLLDPTAYSRQELAALYRQRWQAERDLRSLKVVLGLDVLRCKTPAMVRKEVWAHLLAYNVIRLVLAQAAQGGETSPQELSFKGAVQTVAAFADWLLQADAVTVESLITKLQEAIRSHRVGDRPDRVEPRARKRRPKHYPLLKGSRQQAREKVLNEC